MKYILKVEETIIHELEVEFDTEIPDLTGTQINDLIDKTLEQGEVVYNNYDFNYEPVE